MVDDELVFLELDRHRKGGGLDVVVALFGVGEEGSFAPVGYQLLLLEEVEEPPGSLLYEIEGGVVVVEVNGFVVLQLLAVKGLFFSDDVLDEVLLQFFL